MVQTRNPIGRTFLAIVTLAWSATIALVSVPGAAAALPSSPRDEVSPHSERSPGKVAGSTTDKETRVRLSAEELSQLPPAADEAQSVAGTAKAARYEYAFRVACSGSIQNPGRTSLCAEALLGCPHDPGPLTLVFRRSVDTSGTVVRDWHLIGQTCFPGTRLGRPALTLAHIREALATVPWAKLNTGMQPPNNLTLVTVPVFYQVQWATEGISPGEVVAIDPARMLGYRVELRPVLVGYTYQFGDGSSFGPTPDPGGTYPNGGIAHPYAKAGTYPVRIDATLSAEFRLDGGAWTRIPDQVTVPGIPTSMTVKTARAVLVNR